MDLPIAVSFDLSQSPDERFTFTIGSSTSNLFQVPSDLDLTEDLHIILTLSTPPDAPAATFTSSPSPSAAVALMTPSDQSVVTGPRLDPSGLVLDFTLPVPTHYFAPWSFTIAVDATPSGEPTLAGITSPGFFISQPPTTPATDASPAVISFDLQYQPDSGRFQITDELELDSQQLLINTVTPISVSVTFSSSDSSTFADPPIAFSGLPAGATPAWITNFDPDTPSFRITWAGPGNGAGFRFFAEREDGTVISSPDPILVNATIGDGSS